MLFYLQRVRPISQSHSGNLEFKLSRWGKQQVAKHNSSLLFPHFSYPSTRNGLLLHQGTQPRHHWCSQGYCHSDFCKPAPAPPPFTENNKWTAKKPPGMPAATDPSQMWCSGGERISTPLQSFQVSQSQGCAFKGSKTCFRSRQIFSSLPSSYTWGCSPDVCVCMKHTIIKL